MLRPDDFSKGLPALPLVAAVVADDGQLSMTGGGDRIDECLGVSAKTESANHDGCFVAEVRQ